MSDPRCSGCNRLSPTTLRSKGGGIYWCGRTDCLWRVRELVQARNDGTVAEPLPRVSARWAGQGRVRIKATRGAVTTEGIFTEAEARELLGKLTDLLGPGGHTREG